MFARFAGCFRGRTSTNDGRESPATPVSPASPASPATPVSPVPTPVPAPLRLVLSAHPAKAMYIATKHRLADIIAANGGSMELNELLAKTNIVSADCLYRILRSCESEGIFSVKQDQERIVVHNTPDSCLLVHDVEGSLALWVRHAMYESALSINHLEDVVISKGKDSAWQFYSKDPFWKWLDRKEQEEVRMNFNEIMVNISRKELPHICNDFDWTSFLARIGDGDTCSVVDVGGGKGHLLKAMLEVASFKPVVFDTAHMIEEAREFWEDAGVDVEFVKGDFFKASTIPMANCYVLKHILHDWSDEKCIQILSAIRKQASKVKNSRVMLIELVLDESKPLDHFESWIDIQMMNLVGGKERSRRQWEQDVLSKAGFKLEAVHVTRGTEGIIECRVV